MAGMMRGRGPDPRDTASLFGWVDPGTFARLVDPAADPAPTDEVGTLPMFGGSVAPAPMRHAPEDAAERCDWPENDDDDDPTECGRPAVVIYTSPAGIPYARCRRHDTAAAQRRAATDGWTRRPVAQEDPA